MNETFTLLHANEIETVDTFTLFQRMIEAEENGFHIEACGGTADFMVCYWKKED